MWLVTAMVFGIIFYFWGKEAEASNKIKTLERIETRAYENKEKAIKYFEEEEKKANEEYKKYKKERKNALQSHAAELAKSHHRDLIKVLEIEEKYNRLVERYKYKPIEMRLQMAEDFYDYMSTVEKQTDTAYWSATPEPFMEKDKLLFEEIELRFNKLLNIKK